MAREIIVRILGDASSFTKATQQATGNAEKFGALFGSGFGIGAGIGMWNLAGDAVSKVTDYLVDSVAAAKEEEVGIARMGAALQANVAGWDGNTDAIERQIDAMVRTTGFSDGEMRDSLARLVAATKDTGEAFDIQATAMDLARFKGISLADASDALIKVEAGQYRALKSLGIVLEKGATQTEALAAVQKVAGGQMAAYMDTAAGKSEVLANRLGDLQEEVGSRLTPALTAATERVLGLMDAFDSSSTMTFPERVVDITRVLNDLNPAMWGTNLAFGSFRDQQAAAAEAAGKAAGEAALAWDTGSERIGVALGGIATASGDTTGAIEKDNRKIVTSYADTAAYLLGEYNENYDKALGIQEARSDLHNAKSDEDRAAAYADLAAYGALSDKDFAAWIAALKRMAEGTKGTVHQAYLDAIRDVEALRAAASNPINIKVVYSAVGGANGPGPQPRARGGSASGLTWVGEEGPELVNLPGGSYVHTASQSAAMAARATPGVVNININGAQDVTGIMQQLRRELDRTGMSFA